MLGTGLLLVLLLPRHTYSIIYNLKSCLNLLSIFYKSDDMPSALYIYNMSCNPHTGLCYRDIGVESFALGHPIGSPVEPGLEATLVWLQILCL